MVYRKFELRPNRKTFYNCDKPNNYYTVKEFSKIINQNVNTILNVIKDDSRIPDEGLAYWIVGKNVINIIRQDQVQNYLMNRNVSRQDEEKKNIEQDNLEINLDDISINGNDANSIYDARLKKLKLELIKQSLELQRAKNEVVSMDSISAIWLNMANQIKHNLLAFIPRISPVLAAETDPRICLSILENEIVDVLNNIISLEELKKEFDKNRNEKEGIINSDKEDES